MNKLRLKIVNLLQIAKLQQINYMLFRNAIGITPTGEYLDVK